MLSPNFMTVHIVFIQEQVGGDGIVRSDKASSVDSSVVGPDRSYSIA